MKRLAVIAIVLVACGTDHRKPDDGDDTQDVPYTECGGDPASFVRQALVSLDGHRPRSQAEVDVYVDLYNAVKTAGGDPKETVSRAIMERPEFADRWIDTFMDAMHVQRIDVQNEASCWDKAVRTTVDAGLATAIRMQAATTSGDGKGAWTMADLARSAMVLDDPTPLYRAQIFSMVAHPIPAANVPAKEAELARRADFGETFDSGFLHRDVVCLACHNSERSVTDSDDPVTDRHWPVPGMPEKAVYGTSAGIEMDRAHAAFRVDGFVGGNSHPWGWDADCGGFSTTVGDDIAGVDGKLASLTGKRITVYGLEQALARGFDKLRGQLPPIGMDGAIADPDAALAWLVTLKITEDVWKRATGTSLTIANYFPRNQASSDLLYSLATKFTQSGYSVKALLVAIVQSDYYNRQPPELGCGKEPYTYPAVFDPWVTSDADPERRFNGPGDAVTALDARTLVTATNAALEWPAPPAASRFPDYGDGCENDTCSQMQSSCNQFGGCCNSYKAACMMGGVMPSIEVPFERGVGMFLRNSERGFRGLDFQARLVWEDRTGACARPTWASSDFIDKIVAAGAADTTATVGDVAAAIKDRLIGESAIVDAQEIAAITGLLGAAPEMPASNVTVAAARQFCGALLGSPQFLLQGIAGRGGDRPKLTPTDVGYDAICADVATHVAGKTVSCTGGKLTVQ
ncbi:MAG TPA: hypothetical protein VFV99_27465 [Kofleriaceae bacterium]|nr:hypothetical protein [Kofleriaceae bacterium]